jgi:signal transduction histidine kinase
MPADRAHPVRLGRSDREPLGPGQVLSLLSHELRGPLGVIRGYMRLLVQEPDLTADQSRQAVEATLSASDRVAEILDQTSLLAHLQRGDVKIKRKRVPLAPLLARALQSIDLAADAAASLALSEVPAVEVQADPDRLRTALAALVFAIARAQANAVIVELFATRRAKGAIPGVRLRIEPRLFPRPKTREADLDLKRGGLGLTLPLAAYVIRAHGGLVTELRHGARSTGVQVWLPIAKARPKRRILRRSTNGSA